MTNPPTYDRLLHQLEQAGALERITGLAFGRSPAGSGVTSETLCAIMETLRLPPGIPVAAGLDIGHVVPLCTLAVGGLCELDLERGGLRICKA